MSLDAFGCPEHPTTDLIAILENADENSPLFAAIYPDEAGWGRANMLLAAITDNLRVLVWQGGDRKRRNFPQPIPRPGVSEKEKRVFGNNPIEQDDMDAFLSSRGPAAA